MLQDLHYEARCGGVVASQSSIGVGNPIFLRVGGCAVALGGAFRSVMDNLKSLQEALSVEVRAEELMVLTADLLEDLIEQEGSPCDSPFNSSSPPAIPLVDFLRRLHKYTQFSAECLVIAIVYIDRYNMGQPEFSLNRLNAHKMLLAAVLLAAKFQDDFYYDNKAFEFAGGVNALHLHQLELELFQKLDYNLFVAEEDFLELEAKLYEVYAEPAEQPL